jgi:hypothetical protein
MAGTVHIELSGGLRLAHDAMVERCVVYQPLDRAYIVRIAPDDLLEQGAIVIPQYHGPGEYRYDGGASKPLYPNFDYRLIDLRGKEGLLLQEQAGTTVTITVGEHGRSGAARFEGYRTPEGQSVSGTIAWTCDAVESVVV